MSTAKTSYFKVAKPVWATEKEKEMNFTLGFRAIFGKPEHGPVTVKLAASSIYRIFVNGNYIGCGPARGPHGFYRMDDWDLSDRLEAGRNILAIEVVGYNVNSYYLLDQPSFLQAELMVQEGALAATGNTLKGFEAYVLKERVQKVPRYSFQRTFVEVYKMSAEFSLWRIKKDAPVEQVVLSDTTSKQLIARGVQYPEFEIRNPLYLVAEGMVQKLSKAPEYWSHRFLTAIGPNFKGYPQESLICPLSHELDEFETQLLTQRSDSYTAGKEIIVDSSDFKIFDFDNNYTGFIGLELECTQNTILYLTFDEILIEGDVNYHRLDCINGVKYELERGKYSLETMEPYTLKFLKLMISKGQVKVTNIYLREYAGVNIQHAAFRSSNEKLNRIFEAGVETFRQNSLDIYMDCPSRERAGWLCDSFFTSRVEYTLTGIWNIERNFLENYLLPEKFEYLPEGMLPMCYPADHNDGVFIPNWALWFVLQLEEYFKRSGDREMVDKLKPKVNRLFKYFRKFRNEYGLLEKLEGWVFVEWSEANNLVQDVNYPSNMLYSAAMEVAGHMYENVELVQEALRLRNVIREQAFDGTFFVDNAVRKNGVLEATNKKTEVCQYYAFFFKVASPETHPDLWRILVDGFGPGREKKRLFPKVFPANAFIGKYLRLELLSRYDHGDQVVSNIEDFFDYMALKTGTLWEHIDTHASCNHGFASHVIHCLYRDALGIMEIDHETKVVVIKHNAIDADWCEGWLPVDGSRLYVRWENYGGKPTYVIDAPEGYKVIHTN